MKPCEKCPHPAIEIQNAGFMLVLGILMYQNYVDPFLFTNLAHVADFYIDNKENIRYTLGFLLIVIGILQGLACWCDLHIDTEQKKFAWCRRRSLVAQLSGLFWLFAFYFYMKYKINILSAGVAFILVIGQVYQYLQLNSYIRSYINEFDERNARSSI